MMKECNIEKVTGVLKQFMSAQIEINDLNCEDIENIANKLTELDHDTTTVLKDLIKRVMIIEEKVKHFESQNVREDINKKHTTEINDVQHRLNTIERERRRNNASNK